MQDLDCFRAIYGRKVKLKSIEPKVSAYEIGSLYAYLTEKEARKAGWFANRDRCTVCVTEDNALLPYFSLLPEKEREFMDGPYGSVNVSQKETVYRYAYKIDYRALISAWIEAESPLNWDGTRSNGYVLGLE